MRISDLSSDVCSSDLTDDKALIAVATEAGAPQVVMIDQSHPDAALYASLAQSFPGQMVDFSSYTRDGKQIVVSVYSDRSEEHTSELQSLMRISYAVFCLKKKKNKKKKQHIHQP